MKKSFLYIFFITISCFRAHAVVLPDKNPWLLESITFKTNLPITIEEILLEGGRNGSNNYVINSSTTPIFFVRKDHGWGKFPDVPYSYPSELLRAGYDTTSDKSSDLTFYKLENGNTYVWWVINPIKQKYEWVPGDLSLSGYTLVKNKSSYCIIPVLNINGCEQNTEIRPLTIQLPKSEDFTLEIYFNDKKVLLEGTVSFKLNPGYDPNYKFNFNGSDVPIVEHHSKSDTKIAVPILLLLSMVIVLLSLKTRTKK